MTLNEILLLILGLAGWLWAIGQFLLNRRHQKQDRLIDKRHEVYASFMNRVDEAQNQMRPFLQSLTGAFPKVMAKILEGDDTETDKALNEFNESLMQGLQKAIEPLFTINQDINRMKLVCSARLLPLVERYSHLTRDYCDDYQITVNRMSQNPDISVTAKELTHLGQNNRQVELTSLWTEMVSQMRSELDVGRS